MAEVIKTINGHQIKQLTWNELNDELLKKGDWGLEYYVPGREFESLFITINREKFKFKKFELVERFCKKYPKKDLKNLSYYEIEDLICEEFRKGF